MKNFYKFLFFFWFLFFAGVGLRVYNLNQTLGPGDENQYLIDYANASFKYIATTYFYGGHHIFHTLVMRLMIVLFGDENSIAIRFPAFISGLGTLILVYKLSQIIFKSKFTSYLSLAIIALSPIHIYYSNIARGYNFIIFFSVLMVYSALRIFNSGKFKIWGWVLSIIIFLSIYTIPTNIFFVFGLACWIAMVLFVPRLFKETSFKEKDRKQIILRFSTIFIAAGLITLFAYWPILDQIALEAKNYHLPKTTQSNNFKTVYGTIENLFNLIFKGNLAFFSPFLVLGLFSKGVKKKSYQMLAFFILIIPFLPPLITGVGGYGRNFLFNITMVIPFWAEGFVAFGLCLKRSLKQSNWVLKNGLVLTFLLVSFWETFFVYFPSSKKGFDLNKFKAEMKGFVNPLDLLLITNPKNYWYSHNLYKKNLRRSIFLNRLSGIKIAAENNEELINYQLVDGYKSFSIFKILHNKNLIGSKKTQKGFSIFSLNERQHFTLLEKDFESKVAWRPIKGKGIVEFESKQTLVGDTSLKIMNKKLDETFFVQANLNRVIKVENPMFVVMLWAGLELGKENKGYNLAIPTLILENAKTKKHLALRMGKVNDGIVCYARKVSQGGASKWILSSFIGFVLQGEFNLKLQIATLEGQSAIFDGISLFFFDVPS